MYDLPYERFVDNGDTFAPRRGHRFLEIRNYTRDSGKSTSFSINGIREDEIITRARQQIPDEPGSIGGLQLLLCPKAAGRRALRKIPLSKTTYNSLAKTWRIPPSFLRAICQQLSVVTQCGPSLFEDWRGGGGGTQNPYFHRPSELPSLVIRGDFGWTWDVGIAIMHDPATNVTRCIIVGLSITEMDQTTKYLSRCRDTAYVPLLIPVVALDLASDDISSFINMRTQMLNEIQMETGMDRFAYLVNIAHKDRSKLNLDDIMCRLTCLSDSIAAHSSFSKTQVRLLHMVEDLLLQYNAALSDAERPNQYLREHSDEFRAGQAFRQRLEFVDHSLQSAQQKTAYLQESIEAQVQTIYSLIGQKDNKLNIAAAHASRRIAADSRHVAIMTRRDSTDMRIIAAVTLIFLPATFTATFFSSAFFKFIPEDNGGGADTDSPAPAAPSAKNAQPADALVSPWIWIYAATTAGLTTIVLVCWFFSSRAQIRKMARTLRADEDISGDAGGDLEAGLSLSASFASSAGPAAGARKTREDTLVAATSEKGGRRGRAARQAFGRWSLNAMMRNGGPLFGRTAGRRARVQGLAGPGAGASRESVTGQHAGDVKTVGVAY